MATNVKCCCNYGAAVSGEYPEFGCASCPVHRAALGETEKCKRHQREEARCKAITYAGQPEHLLTRCSLEEDHPEPNHLPSFTDEDRNS